MSEESDEEVKSEDNASLEGDHFGSSASTGVDLETALDAPLSELTVVEEKSGVVSPSSVVEVEKEKSKDEEVVGVGALQIMVSYTGSGYVPPTPKSFKLAKSEINECTMHTMVNDGYRVDVRDKKYRGLLTSPEVDPSTVLF